MFNLRLCNAAIILYSQLKFEHMYLCGMDYKYFSPHWCKCNSFGCTAAIRWGNACHGPHSDNLYSGSEHSQFNSPRLVKREAGFPNPRRALIGSNQLWRVNDSPYYWIQRSRDTHVCIEMVGPIICHILQDNEPWCRLYMDTRAWEAVGNPTRQEFVTNFVWFCWYWWYYNCTILKIQWTISNRFRHGLRNVWPTAEYGCRSSYNGLRTLRLGLWALRP